MNTNELFSLEFGSQDQTNFDLTQTQVERGTIAFFKDGTWPENKDFSAIGRYLDRKINYLHDYIKNMMPVGTILSSFDPTPFNKYFLSLNGELISAATRPLLYAKLLSLGFKPDGQSLIKLPDMRGTVQRAQNKGRFTDVTEINLGAYQADATQKVVGGMPNVQFGGSNTIGISPSPNSWAVTPTGQYGQYGIATTSFQGIFSMNYDNSRTIRTALEERVKATGAHFQIFAGVED